MFSVCRNTLCTNTRQGSETTHTTKSLCEVSPSLCLALASNCDDSVPLFFPPRNITSFPFPCFFFVNCLFAGSFFVLFATRGNQRTRAGDEHEQTTQVQLPRTKDTRNPNWRLFLWMKNQTGTNTQQLFGLGGSLAKQICEATAAGWFCWRLRRTNKWWSVWLLKLKSELNFLWRWGE